MAVNIYMTYDPKNEGAAKVRLPDGSVRQAAVTRVKIIDGHIWDPEAVRQTHAF